MAWIRRLLIRLRSSFSHARQDQELEAEIAAHLDFAIEENIKHGMSPEEARRQALIRFGGVEQAKQQQREARGLPALEILWQDLRYAMRTLRRDRSFALIAILILALGIGATTAMFSIIHVVLLKPLVYQDPGQLVLSTQGITPVRFNEMRAASRSYSGLGAYSGKLEHFAFSGIREPEVLNGARVSGNFLQILGVVPLHGRSFIAAEDKEGAPAVAMISAELWQRRFGGDIGAVGKTITLSGAPHTIVGILPPGFQFPFPDVDVWVTRPSESSLIDPPSRPISPTLTVFGRLKANVDIRQADAERAVLKRQYAAEHPGMLDAKPNSTESVQFLKDELVADIRPKLWLLFGTVVLVLLIACANVGSLLLARAATRSREFAVRAAIGAGRSRIIKQLFVESLLLAFLGGGIGLGIAALSLSAVRSMTSIDLPRTGEIHMDGIVVGFALALSVLTAVLFGLVPSLIASRPDLAGVLKGSGEIATAIESGTSKTKVVMRFGPRGLLVVGQVALSVVLLIGATLLIESLARVYRVDPGFQPSNLLTMHIALPPARYDTDAKRATFYEELVRSTESLPGVRGAAVSSTLPMAGPMGIPVQLKSGPAMKLNQRPIALLQFISPEYFHTMEIPLKRGREFTAHDNLGSAPVAIINETMARHFWPQYPNGPSPIGQIILMGAHQWPNEIVGIAADVREKGKDRNLTPGLYLPAVHANQSAAFIVRTDGDPLSLANAVRHQVLAIDSGLPVSGVMTMEDVVEAPQGQLRLMMRLLGVFATAATLLAIIGLCGVISYSVIRRTKEIGIRCALGAQRRNIISLVIEQGLVLSIVGVLLGIVMAFALTRVLRDFLFRVRPADPLTFAGISILFVLVAVAASYIPAHKAIKIDPMTALRTE